MSSDEHQHAYWVHEPFEETLDGARRLTVSVVDRTMHGWWEDMARLLGVPARRWRRHHPLGAAPEDRPIAALIDGAPAMDAAAWTRFASLVPGAVALPARTAALMSVSREALAPPGRPPHRLADLWRTRRRQRRLRQEARTVDADLIRFRAALARRIDAALADGEDGTPFADLPAHALAVRLLTLTRTAGWSGPLVLVDIALGDATVRLERMLRARGVAVGAVAGAAARLSSGGGLVEPRRLEELRELARRGDESEAALGQWLGRYGWHAAQELHLEATPLRHTPEQVRRLLTSLADEPPPSRGSGEDAQPADSRDSEVTALAAELRRWTRLREEVARDRAELHAACRALAWTLGDRLANEGAIAEPDDVFDLSLRDCVAVASGGRPVDALDASTRRVPDAPARTELGIAPPGVTLRGTGASAGAAVGAVVVLDEPTLDAAVDGCVVVCRVTDPGWMPLLQRCAGLVTERGGPLSHAAIVARELRLPAVVAVPEARAKLRCAASVRVDGTAGTVEVLTDR